MIEDALGLKIYHYKKEESEKRLEKTRENISHVGALRKEIAPHLAFLKKQVERVEKAVAMRDELAELYREYLKRESVYLQVSGERFAREKKGPQDKLEKLERELTKAKEAVARASETDNDSKKSLELEKHLSEARGDKERLSRELGRLEGQIAFEEKEAARRASAGEAVIPVAEVEKIVREVEKAAEPHLPCLMRE